jgi:hypothetical protein
MFVRQVKLSIGDDQQRAGWTGHVSERAFALFRLCLMTPQRKKLTNKVSHSVTLGLMESVVYYNFVSYL